MKKEDKIPKFKTIMEESNFWDENSPLDLFDESDLKEVEFQVQKKSPEKIYLAIKLEKPAFEKIKSSAKKRHISPGKVVEKLADTYL